LASRSTKSWKTVRGESALNERRVATYERLLESEERIAQACYRRGASDDHVQEALAASERDDAETQLEEGLYMCTLARFVAALGGRLEVVAVFPEETIVVRREPEAGSPAA
jgi:hypothetical protein